MRPKSRKPAPQQDAIVQIVLRFLGDRYDPVLPVVFELTGLEKRQIAETIKEGMRAGKITGKGSSPRLAASRLTDTLLDDKRLNGGIPNKKTVRAAAKKFSLNIGPTKYNLEAYLTYYELVSKLVELGAFRLFHSSPKWIETEYILHGKHAEVFKPKK